MSLLSKLNIRRNAYVYFRSRQFSLDTSIALDTWIAKDKELVLDDNLHPRHISDLYITLPTRDGTRGGAHKPPQLGEALGYGHHLAFFHPRTPEPGLRPDGTDADFCPPEPFVRRMWAGGRMEWRQPLRIGADYRSKSIISSVQKKGFDRNTPMVFVKQHIEISTPTENSSPHIVEERTHVYLAQGTIARTVRKVDAVPQPAFSFTYTPSLTTLFRFSALTFNGHHIHLDRDYAQLSEGYPERLVHGPLTALMLLENLVHHHPKVQMKSFDYRAINPVIVNQPCHIHGLWEDDKTAFLWAEDQEGVIGMTGTVLCR